MITSDPPSPVTRNVTALRPEIHANIKTLHTVVNSQRQSFEYFKEQIGVESKSGTTSPRGGSISALSKPKGYETLVSR